MKYIKTNMGLLPLDDFKEIMAYSAGFNSYNEMRACGITVDIDDYEICEKEKAVK